MTLSQLLADALRDAGRTNNGIRGAVHTYTCRSCRRAHYVGDELFQEHRERASHHGIYCTPVAILIVSAAERN